MNNLKLLIVFSIAVLFSSCEDYLDINQNPNAATTAPIDGLLANVTYSSGTNTASLAGMSNFWVQYQAGVNANTPTDIYEPTNASGTWNAIYLTLADNYDMITFAQESGASHHEAIGKTMLAYHLFFIADYWGAGPYDEAFTGETATPAWESGEYLYSTANDLLDEALVLFSDDSPAIELDDQSDVLHFGDIDAWVKTVYAIKARAANHLSKTSAYNATEVLSALSNSYTSNADDLEMASFQTRNPWAQVALNNEDLLLGGFLSEQFIDAMNGDTFGVFDPRLPLITDETQFGDYRGTVNGEGRVGDGISDEESYLETSGFYSSENSPIFMITNAELRFIEAEAYLRDNQPGPAYDAYLAGIEANMDKMGVEESAKQDYMTDPVVAVGSSGITLDLIFKEKYVALFLNPETWNDMRRHNYQYEDFTLPTGAVLNEFVRIASTPERELTLNRDNAIENEMTDRVWWDE